MRIITNSFESVSGLDILGTGLLVFFFLLFLWIIYRIIRTNKSDNEKWAQIPLENEILIDKSNHNKSE